MIIKLWQPTKLFPDGVMVTCNCKSENIYGEEVPAKAGLKKIPFDKLGKIVRRMCRRCKCRWKIKIVEDENNEHINNLGYIAYMEEIDSPHTPERNRIRKELNRLQTEFRKKYK